ncbi:MAG: UMP kinase [Spirochaetes bacterium RBG_16_49_21]|nr:MAG: UMP kinase [Spirochaetes bacterium RBG_16_49_21]
MAPGSTKPSVHYRRILLKLSGEALAGENKTGISSAMLSGIAREIRDIHELGIEIAVVIGGGNLFRGSTGEGLGIRRVAGDYMGMLATVMNSLAFQNALEAVGVPARVMCPFSMREIAEPYIIRKALDHLEHGRVVIASGGTGHPFFTTDTAASLRGVELGAEVLLKATRVDGVYTSDPEQDAAAQKIEFISYIDVLKGQLRIMDFTAVSLCMDNTLPIIVFNLFKPGSLSRIVAGESVGTLIS